MSKKEESQDHSSESEDENNQFEEVLEKLKKVDNDDIRKVLETKINSIRTKRNKKKSSRISKLKSKIDYLKLKKEDPKFLIKRDEIIYSIVLTSFVFTFGLLFYPLTNVKFAYILIKLGLLFFIRFFDFRARKWHYYLMEYCYFANILMFVSLIFGNKNKFLLTTFFTNAFGPVASSFLLLRYTIAWHDLTAYTSFFMHIAPALVAWITRFHVLDDGHNNNTFLPTRGEWDQWLDGMGWAGYWKIYSYGALFYICWMVSYYFMQFHVLFDRIKRKGNETLFVHTKNTNKMFQALLKKLNKNDSPVVERLLYMSMHGTVSLISIFFSSLLIYHRFWTFGVVIVLMIMPIWSTSGYYHEYFSKKYQQKIEKAAEMNRSARLEKEAKKQK